MKTDKRPLDDLAGAADPELDALPPPRRPWRRLTLLLMTVTAVASSAMVWKLWGEAVYPLKAAKPVDIQRLDDIALGPELSNEWVRAEAALDTAKAVSYSRPLEKDEYRLLPVEGRADLWIELRIPEPYTTTSAHFIPPATFVGRLVPMADAGLRYAGLQDDVDAVSGLTGPRNGAWVLIDGETPGALRWATGLALVFVGFAAFNLWGLTRLLVPMKAESRAP